MFHLAATRQVLRQTARRVAVTATLLGVLLVAALGAELVRWRVLEAPTSSLAPPPAGGSLVIGGGGRLPDSVIDEFLHLAGGANARILIIPTANPAFENRGGSSSFQFWRQRRVSSVDRLHTSSRSTADTVKFAQPISRATGVWLGGGDQQRLARVYADTEVERELLKLLQRSGVIGGNSAGSAVMTRVMISGGSGANPSVDRGLALLDEAVIDQHFVRRNRFDRLRSVIARRPELVGLGIDERTALVVGIRQGRLRVVGDSYVVAYSPDSSGGPPRQNILKPGDQTDMESLHSPNPIISSALVLDDALEVGK
jgi:cyanophycinase